VLFNRSPLIIFSLAAAFSACGSDSSRNTVKAAFAQRPPSRIAAPVAFRLPEKPGTSVRVYRLPKLDEVTFRFNTPGLAASRIVGYSEDDDQIYLLNPRSALISLDLGTGRSRTIDSSVAEAVSGPTGSPFVVHNDGSIAAIENRTVVAWPAAKLAQPPTSVIAGGKGILIVETRSQGKRKLTTLSALRPPVTQDVPEGQIVATRWGDAVLVGTDSGLVTLNPVKIQKARFHSMKNRPQAIAVSPSAHRIYATDGSDIVVFDRFSNDEVARQSLPGVISEIRNDPWGRYLLLRPARGDSIWLFDTSADRYVATLGGKWDADLPAVAADGSILSRQGNDVVTIAGDSLTTAGRIRGNGGDQWISVVWDPRRPALKLAEEAEPTAQTSSAVLYVQVSVSQNESWAQDLSENLKRSGMNASVLPPTTPEEGYRVVLGPYPTREAADDAGRKLGKPFWVFSRDQAPTTP
jgi:hypothetical protein